MSVFSIAESVYQAVEAVYRSIEPDLRCLCSSVLFPANGVTSDSTITDVDSFVNHKVDSATYGVSR